MSLPVRFFVWVAGLIAVLVTALCIVMSVSSVVAHEEKTKVFFQNQALLLAKEVGRLVLWDDRVALSELLTQTVSTDQAIDYAFVEKRGKPYVYTFAQGVPRGLLGRYTVPAGEPSVWAFEDEGGEAYYDIALSVAGGAGVLHLGLRRSEIGRNVRQLLLPFIFGAVVIVLGAVLSLVFARAAGSRIRELTAELRANEQRYRAVVEGQTDLVGRFLPNTTWTFVNDAICRFFGASKEGLLGESLLAYVPEDDRPGFLQALALITPENPERTYDQEVVLPDGTKRWIQWLNTGVFDDEGRIVEYQSTGRDITERKRMEEALEERHNLLRTLMDTVPDLFFVKDTESRFITANVALLKHVGMDTPDEIVGKTDFAFSPRKLAEQYLADEQTLFRSGEPVLNRIEKAVSPDGSERWHLTNKVPLRDRSGTIVGLVGVVRDITERVHAEEKQREMEARAQEAQKFESLGVLAGGIAHDFNNLLMGVLGNAELALDILPTGSHAREYVGHIEESAKQAAELCHQMLAYAGKGKLTIDRVYVDKLVESIGHLLAISASNKAVIKYDFANDLPPIAADAGQIRQIVIGLVTNASEAMSETGGTISVRTRVRECDRDFLDGLRTDWKLPEGQYVCIEVTDTGSGMDAKTLARIFDPFFSTKFTGRGLGLAAVLGIVCSHKGGISVHSEPGEGTTVKVLLPSISEAEAPVVADVVEASAQHGKGAILLVDNEDIVRDVGKRMLEKSGYTVISSGSGREAIEIFQSRSDEISCILLDLTMPEMDGEETFHELRRIQADVKILVMSGRSAQEVSDRFAGQTNVGFVSKPYHTAELGEKLRELLTT